MSQHQAAFTLLSYARLFPEQPTDSPFLLPSEQFPLPSETAPDGLRHTKQNSNKATALPDRHGTATEPK